MSPAAVGRAGLQRWSSHDNGGMRLILAGDVMTGRGIDQVLSHPGSPVLHESHVRDARDYVRLAEGVSGPVPAPVADDYPWGDALPLLRSPGVDLRIVNLETAVTTSDAAWPGKGVHYRMHPANIGCLTAARIDCAVLANNHLLDWGHPGLSDTLKALQDAGVATAGAGADAGLAHAPARLPLAGGRAVLVFAVATASSGVPADWAARPDRAGVALLPDLSPASAQALAGAVSCHRRPGDRVVVSIHWGGNWVPSVPPAHRQFARALVDLGAADIVHGHSAHHPMPFEVHRGKLILYGCGDLLNDYEGIALHAQVRSDLAGLFIVTVDAGRGTLRALEVVPLCRRRLRLAHADPDARAAIERLVGGRLRIDVASDRAH